MLPNPLEEVARKLDEFNKRLSSLERLESFESDIGARVFNSIDVAIPSGAFTAQTFDSERYDTDNIHSVVANTDRLTAQTAGKYAIHGQIHFDRNATGVRIIRLRLNGATSIAQVNEENPENVADNQMEISTIYELSVADFVTLELFQSSGGNLGSGVDANRAPEFMMQRVG